MRAIRRAGLALALGGVLAANAAPTFAADTGSVEATVTVATPCILVITTAIDFGSTPFANPDPVGISSAGVSYQNCSDSIEHIWVGGTDATGPSATWELDGQAPATCAGTLNAFQLWFANLYVSEEYRELELLGANASNAHSAQLYMPCVGSDGAGQTMSFQLTLSATF